MYNGYVRSTVNDMKNIYFIDSENVGDSWVALLANVTEEDELIVFYTRKSPHMNYKNVVLLLESTKKVQFIECLEGNNALDFQLSTELGFRLSTNHEDAFIIVSNDNGYNAVVSYWEGRNVNISRITGKALSVLSEALSEAKMTAASTVPEEVKEAPETTSPAVIAEKAAESQKVIIDDNAKELLYIFGKANLQLLHESLQQLYGAKSATPMYTDLKSGNTYAGFIAEHPSMSLQEKQKKYCSIVFSMCMAGEEMPEGFSDFVLSVWKAKKNLNSLRSSLQTQYGKNKGASYYSVFKVHIKILANIK